MLRPALPALAALAIAGLVGAGCARLFSGADEVVSEPCPARGEAPAGAPDVLVVSIDTLRPDRIGAYGYAPARTPEIDALAASGVLFEQATTPLPRTTPGLASLLTGLAPVHHGSLEVGTAMTSGTSIATALCANGWTAEAVTASTVAGPAQKLAQGFARFAVHGHAPGEALTDAALARVAAADADRPLFLWVHYLDPHAPYLPPASFAGQPAAPGCRKLMEQIQRREIALDHVYLDRDGISSRVRDECLALYDAEIAYVDGAVGRLLRRFGELRGDRARFIALTADHGENFGERGLFYEHGPNVHDASLRIPLIVAGTGVPAGRRDAAPARLEDVAPTLLARAGVPAERRPPSDGVDLGARVGGAGSGAVEVAVAEAGSALLPTMSDYLVSGRAGETHCVNGPRFSLCSAPGAEAKLYDHDADPDLAADVAKDHPDVVAELRAIASRWVPEQTRERTARTPSYKLVERPSPEGGYAASLYDLRTDPGEANDVATAHPDVVARLRATLPALDPAARPAAERDPKVLDQLRSLGYVE